jgi:hypothetical protein
MVFGNSFQRTRATESKYGHHRKYSTFTSAISRTRKNCRQVGRAYGLCDELEKSIKESKAKAKSLLQVTLKEALSM